MRKKDFQNLVKSIKQAREIMRGERKPSRVFKYTPSEVKKIREAYIIKKRIKRPQVLAKKTHSS